MNKYIWKSNLLIFIIIIILINKCYSNDSEIVKEVTNLNKDNESNIKERNIENNNEKDNDNDNDNEKNVEKDNEKNNDKDNENDDEKKQKIENNNDIDENNNTNKINENKIEENKINEDKVEENKIIEDKIEENNNINEDNEKIKDEDQLEKDENNYNEEGSIHTSIMEGLYKLDYKLKLLRKMLKKDKKMIIQIHALGYLADSIKQQITRDVAALNATVKMESENAIELNKLQSIHDAHVTNKLEFTKHENIVAINN